jgi:hypothetical protein
MRDWLNVPTTNTHDCERSKLKLWSDLSSDMISCMNTITNGVHGCLHKVHSTNVSHTDIWQLYRD